MTLATGPDGSAYAEFGQRYAQALAKNHIQVKLLTTEGSLANLQALRAGDADVAFVRGGSADPAADGEAGITSLGALFYEPLWVFYRPAALVKQAPAAPKSAASAPVSVTTLGQLKGLRVNIDQPGSGVPEIVHRLLQANGMDASALVSSPLPPAAAAEALLGGYLDAMVLVTAPESPVVERLLRAPGVALMDVAQADAYARRFPFLQPVTLPRGVVDLRPTFRRTTSPCWPPPPRC